MSRSAKRARRAADPENRKEATLARSPGSRKQGRFQTPDAQCPNWLFRKLDQGGPWDLEDCREDLGKILTRLGAWEVLSWNEIKIRAKKKNHNIDVYALTKKARDRLDALGLEAESLMALHIENTKVLYGVQDGADFWILWYDPNHGDNEECVCRSRKK